MTRDVGQPRDTAAAVERVEALHVKVEVAVYSDVDCIEGDCDHEDPRDCPLAATAVCRHCSDLSDAGDGWEHPVSAAAYWPCTTRRALEADR